MYDVFTLEKEINLNGIKLNKLKATTLTASHLLEAKKHKPDSPEFEKSLVLGVFAELCDDDLNQIHVRDYIRMGEVVEEMIAPQKSANTDFLT